MPFLSFCLTWNNKHLSDACFFVINYSHKPTVEYLIIKYHILIKIKILSERPYDCTFLHDLHYGPSFCSSLPSNKSVDFLLSNLGLQLFMCDKRTPFGTTNLSSTNHKQQNLNPSWLILMRLEELSLIFYQMHKKTCPSPWVLLHNQTHLSMSAF